MRLGSEKRRGGGSPRQRRAATGQIATGGPELPNRSRARGGPRGTKGSQNPRHPVESPPLIYQLSPISPSCQNSLNFRKFSCSQSRRLAGTSNAVTVTTTCKNSSIAYCVTACSGAKVAPATLYGAPAFGTARRHTSAEAAKPGNRHRRPTVICTLIGRRR